MEKFKRKYSIDAPVPFSIRRKSEPVVFSTTNTGTAEGKANHAPGRRYSTALNSPMTNLHGRADSEAERYNRYSTNKQVRKLSMSLALEEALLEQYGYTPIYGIPLVYTPPPDKLYTSTCSITISQPAQSHKASNKNC